MDVTTIEASRGFVPLNLSELWKYRELLYFLLWRDIKGRYKQTVLGATWAIIQPFFTMVVFSLFFGKLADMPSDGLPYPLFSYTPLVPWTFFAQGLTQSSNLGALVNIITRKPEQGFHAAANLSSGSYDFLNPSATIQYANGRFSALGGYSYRISHPFVDGSGKSFTQYGNYLQSAQDSDAFAIGTAWGKFSVSPRSNHLMQISYSRQQADRVLYPYLMMDAIYDDADRVYFGYQVEHPFGRVESLTFQGYDTQVKHWMTDEFRTSSLNTPRGYSMGTYATTSAAGGKLEAGLKDLTFGLEVFNPVQSPARAILVG